MQSGSSTPFSDGTSNIAGVQSMSHRIQNIFDNSPELTDFSLSPQLHPRKGMECHGPLAHFAEAIDSQKIRNCPQILRVPVLSWDLFKHWQFSFSDYLRSLKRRLIESLSTLLEE